MMLQEFTFNGKVLFGKPVDQLLADLTQRCMQLDAITRMQSLRIYPSGDEELENVVDINSEGTLCCKDWLKQQECTGSVTVAVIEEYVDKAIYMIQEIGNDVNGIRNVISDICDSLHLSLTPEETRGRGANVEELVDKIMDDTVMSEISFFSIAVQAECYIQQLYREMKEKAVRYDKLEVYTITTSDISLIRNILALLHALETIPD